MRLPALQFGVTLDKGRGFDQPPVTEKPDWQEYYFTQQIVAGFNSDCLEVKKWSVTAASGIAVIGSVAEVRPTIVFAIVALLALAFWLTETIWRMNQWAFIRSIRQIEERSRAVPGAPQVSTRWTSFYGAAGASAEGSEGTIGAGWRHFRSMRTMLPHVFVFAASAAGLILSVLHLMTLTPKEPAARPVEVHAVVSGSLETKITPPSGAKSADGRAR